MSTVPKPLDMAAILADTSNRVIVCCGAGGVGKTTTAAAIALRAAEYGRIVVVLTIDPAKRLARPWASTTWVTHPNECHWPRRCPASCTG